MQDRQRGDLGGNNGKADNCQSNPEL